MISAAALAAVSPLQFLRQEQRRAVLQAQVVADFRAVAAVVAVAQAGSSERVAKVTRNLTVSCCCKKFGS